MQIARLSAPLPIIIFPAHPHLNSAYEETTFLRFQVASAILLNRRENLFTANQSACCLPLFPLLYSFPD